MDSSTSLFVYIICFIISMFVFIRIGIRTVSAVMLSLFTSFVVLNMILPPQNLNGEDVSQTTVGFYMLIDIGTIIVLIGYALFKAFNDVNTLA